MKTIAIFALVGFVAALLPAKAWLVLGLFILAAATVTGFAAWGCVIYGIVRAWKENRL